MSLPHTPVPSQWAAATGQDIASVSAVPGYGVETYVDNWMNYFDRSSNGASIFEGGQHDFARTFAPPEARSFSLDATSSQFYPAASTAGTTAATSAAILPMSSMPLDPSLGEGHRQAAGEPSHHSNRQTMNHDTRIRRKACHRSCVSHLHAHAPVKLSSDTMPTSSATLRVTLQSQAFGDGMHLP